MKIYVVGTCQAIPLAACLTVMHPDVPVVRLPVNADLSAFQPDDVVFRQRDRPVMTPVQRDRKEIIYPGVWFNAFHPDVVYVTGPWGAVAPPLGSDHSSIVLYGWHRGLSAAQTAKLFTEAVFEQLRFFDCWGEAKRALLEEGRDLGFPFDATLARAERFGCFMHSPIHPALVVMADLARALSQRAGLTPAVGAPESYLEDPMLRGAVWPVYPEIGRRLGLPGAYAFKPVHAPATIPQLLDLDEFVARSFEAYATAPPASLACRRLENPAYRDLERVAAGERKGSRNGAPPPAPAPAERTATAPSPSPYADLPAERFWRRAVERVIASDVDPVGTPPFRIGRSVRIATAGSCFAQSMSRVLARAGYEHFVAEPPPDGMPPEQARVAGYGVFSVRCGNVYTARQLLQLFDRAYGTLVPRDRVWLRPDGRYADPFRPLIEPEGFACADDVLAARELHLAAVRTMFERLDVLIFTLGLTEAWRAKADGAVFPLAPGVSAGRFDPALYEFVNFTAAEVRDDLHAFLARLRGVNASARVVLTVSPQPPIATYEPRHVLVSAAYTKAALRVAADEVERAHANVWYFPGYELVAGGFNRGAYFQSDLRTVTPQGVDHVMRLFLEHCAAEPGAPAAADAPGANEALDGAVCDEEAIAYGGAPAVSSGRYGTAPHPEWADYEWSADFDIEVAAAPAPAADAVMEALAPSSMRAPVRAEIPPEMHARTVVTVSCTVRNGGDTALVSAGKHPVFLCYRWFDERGDLTEIGRSIHTPLPGALEPGAEIAVPMRIEAPQYEGRYRLRVALLQSEIAWFDDVDAGNGIDAAVGVTAKRAQPV
jgi:GSCFA family/Polysaccharide biosynthesis enzyme WcbI